MQNRGLNYSRALAKELARKETKKERKEKIFHYGIITFTIFVSLLFIFFLVLDIIKLTGYAGYLEGYGGSVTDVNIDMRRPTTYWGGIYGIALRVSGFTEQIYRGIEYGSLTRVDIFFDCLQFDASGGARIFASTNPNVDFLGGTIVPATLEEIDTYTGCTTTKDCAGYTFDRLFTVTVAGRSISNVPGTYSFKYDGANNVFDIAAINIDGSLVFITHVNTSIQKGFSPNVTVNYQMLLPTPENSTPTYYFFNDPNDVCPSGGVGSSINATVSGYVTDTVGLPIENAEVTIAGYTTYSDASGFYNLSTLVLPGTYTIVSRKTNYYPYIDELPINTSAYVLTHDIVMEPDKRGQEVTTMKNLEVNGLVTDTASSILTEVNVSFGNNSGLTNNDGWYSFNTSVVMGSAPIIAVKENFNNYYALLIVGTTTDVLNHNITMEPVNLNAFPTGPKAIPGGPGQVPPVEVVRTQASKNGDDFWVSTNKIKKEVRQGTFAEESITIFNFKGGNMQTVFSLSSDLQEFVKLDRTILSIAPNTYGSLSVTIYGTKPPGIYTGTLSIKGDIQQEIPVEITIVDKKMPIETLIMGADILNKVVRPGSSLRYKLELQNLLIDESYMVKLNHVIRKANTTEIISSSTETVEIGHTLTLLEEMPIWQNTTDGEYTLYITAEYLNLVSSIESPFIVAKPIYLNTFFGIPLWIIFLVISVLSFSMFNVFLYKRHLDKKKRYHLALELNLLPKPGDRSIKLGKVAETNIPAYYDMDAFCTHGIVAGATGGGKSISAQVFVEEMLLKNIAVVVFDPTAQWSGMLRKCDDKKMMSFYPKFGLKPSDAKAFPGNVRQIKNAHQKIDITKYMNPGQIQVFTMNKLDPKEIDIFVAGVIASIFRTGPEEHPGLRLLLVFDEVHRLLPKFGGSGKGFLQIERACREFRKWGFGVLLVSQVLSDFVGEIKANINTEVQMRVAEENDLQRIKERYGEDALKSLVRADVGTAMIQNAEYNRGRPYFVAMRPILHNTRRLSDEILDKYNAYSDTIDDLLYQIQQLEELKIDTFDLKMELKLVKDKLMTGNFSVVDIYLEGLKPRIEKQWQTLGKTPKKKEIELIEDDIVEAALKEAQKEHNKAKEDAKKEEAQEKAVVETPEMKMKKIVTAFTFDNGMMVASVKEFLDTLPTIENEVMNIHVNDQKNEIADWLGKVVDPKLGESLKSVKDKNEIKKVIEEFYKGTEKKEDQKTDKKDEKSPDKDSEKKDEKIKSDVQK